MRVNALECMATLTGYAFTEENDYYILKRNSNKIAISKFQENILFIENDVCRLDDLKMLEAALEFARTPKKKRIDQYVVPLRGLRTPDNEQQFLSYKDGYWFASKWDEALIQSWDTVTLIPLNYRKGVVKI